MKQLLIFILSLFSIGAMAQTIPQVNNVPWYQFNRKLSVGERFQIPLDTMSMPAGATVRDTSGLLAIKGTTLYFLYNGTWINVSSASATIDSSIYATVYRVDTATNSIRGEIAGKVDIADTSAMLGAYFNQAIRSGDSIIFYNSGVRLAGVYVGGGGTWGSITGTLSSQTDLQNALNAKAALIYTDSSFYHDIEALNDSTFILKRRDATSDTVAILVGEPTGGGTWGTITGTLSSQTDLQSALDAKQATLVSGTNIKTVNGSTILGSGNLSVTGAAQSKAITLELPGSSESITLFYTDVAITVTKVADVLTGSSPSVTYDILHATARTIAGNELFGTNRTATSTSGATTTTFNDATIPAGSWVWLVTSATSGVITDINITITYTID